MKNLYFFLTLVLLIPISSISSQNVPIDFEDGGFGADWTWTVFENDANPPLEIIANPDMSGINTSARVAKFTALQTGNPWAGCESLHGADIGSFVIDATNSTIRIMVWKSTISDVGIKLVTATGWAKPELKVANTKINEWEQLTFDFSTVDHENMTYDQIVIFPDFIARNSDEVIYFDNVYGDVATNTSIDNLVNEEIKITPNPVQDIVTITAENSIREVSIYNLAGELVLTKAMNDSNTINIADLAKGMYVIKANVDGQMVVDKLMKL